MKRVLSVIMLLCVAMFALAKGDNMPKYDISGAGSGVSGTVLVKVYVYQSKATDEELKCAATHGVVFRGIVGNNSGTSQPAMASPTAEKDNETFCAEFFSASGECQNYASIVNGSYDRVKTSKGYKVGAIIQVNKSALRKAMEKAGVVRSLSAGF